MSEIFTRAFLNSVLDREGITSTKLGQLMGIDEGQFHEFKGGPTDKQSPPEVLRKYLAGFANAEGGVLVMGVANTPPRQAVDATTWLPQNLEQWASDSTRALLPFLAMPPVSRVVDCDGKKVLLVAVDRAPLLVPCIEGGQSLYYYRSGPSTFQMRESLMADLILGRRRGPTMAITSAGLDYHRMQLAGVCEIQFSLMVDNESLGFASDLSAGIVTWALGTGPHIKPNAELLRAVDLIAPDDGLVPSFLRRSNNEPPGDAVIRPFATELQISFQGRVRVPERPARVRFAAYLAPRDCAPQWFQCSLDWSPDTSPSTQRTRYANIERVYRTRPIVEWKVLNNEAA